MLPVTHGERYTALHILLYTLILLAVSLLPYAIHMSGRCTWPAPWAGPALPAMGLGVVPWHRPHAAINTFKYSIGYLFALFIALLVDHYLLLNL
jgi:protoheme IX farnesyltransferase